MPASPHFKRAQRPAQGGFALVIALSLMAFVLLLLLSITTLVQVETQGSQIQLQQMEAEQSALLGLQIAIGELQKTAGPDQRITATASINDAPNIAQPHLLGVWESFKQENDSNAPINYAVQKNSDFVQWLSSTAAITDKTNQAYPTAAPTNSVILVGDGTLPTPDADDPTTQYVQASTVDVLGANGNRVGGYAWHVFDESQKANLTLKNPATATDAERVGALGVAGAPNFTALANASDGDALYSPLENLSAGEQEKAVSLSAAALLGDATFNPQAANAFHVLTTDSKSLLVDVANGGFQKDLSLLFEFTPLTDKFQNLPNEYKDRYIYSESNTPVADAPTRFLGAEPMPSPDPKWSLLRSHYGLYKDKDKDGNDKLSTTAGVYGVAASKVVRAATPSLPNEAGFFDEQQLLPVVSNAQFIFSMGAEGRNVSYRKGALQYDGFLGLWTDVVLTLWNPYNIELRVPSMEVEFYRFPLQVEFFRQNPLGGWDSATQNQPVHISQMFAQSNSVFGGGSVQDSLPYRGRIGNSFVLKPGEYKVFHPVSQTYNHKNMNYTSGLELEEGWSGNGSGGNVGGGIFERYIAVDRNYAGLNHWPEMVALGFPSPRAQISINVGDVIGVEVSPAKIDRNTSFAETNDEEIVAYMKVFQGDAGDGDAEARQTSNLSSFQNWLSDRRTHVGAVEINMPDSELGAALGSYGINDMSQLTVFANELPNQPKGNSSDADKKAFSSFKRPFLIASLRLKTESDSDGLVGQPNGSVWLYNGITNQYFTNGLKDDQDVQFAGMHQYELTWEPMDSWNNIPTVEVDSQDRGYGGTGITSETGVNFAPYHQIPLAPATSIAQFSHAPLNTGGQAPLTAQIVGNSFNSPLIPLANKTKAGSVGTHLDHSYLANNTLFDGYFLSTATAQTQAIYETSRSLTAVIDEFFDPTQPFPLPNSNFEPATNIAPTVTAADYDTFAQHLYNKGAFNVNSTSKEAWALFLASGTNEALPVLDMLTASTTLANAAISSDSAVSRFAPMIGDEEAPLSDVEGQDRWQVHRRLTSDQIMTLAENVVDEVKARGPFQSVAEFVNRQLVSDPLTGNSGALQTAIENSALNPDFGLSAPKNNSELTGAGTGNTSDGAATQITQADLLNRLAPSLTVRGDTFRIRAYGEVTDFGGQTTKAWCEAVVQRQHDFVDAEQESTTIDASLSITNQAFGRRFNIVSFRWLSADEV